MDGIQEQEIEMHKSLDHYALTMLHMIDRKITGRKMAMRLNYYEFPKEIDPHTRFLNGASCISGHCSIGRFPCRDCDIDSWDSCAHYRCDEADTIICGCSVTTAKKLLRKFGGQAWTEHCERDGSVFELTPIKLTGNNSRFRYNRHL